MPIIQRNLFPRRPPKEKCNGPSILRLNDSVNDNRNKAKNNLNSKSSEKNLVKKLSDSNLFGKREAVIIAQRLADVQKISKKKFLDSSESSDSRYVSKNIYFVYLF
jgi:hypothetical protein